MSLFKRRFKIPHLSTVSFKILEFNDACSMIASCIPHCSYFPPAVTISELKDIITSVISIISPCNMGQYEGDAAILSLFVSLTRQEDSVVHIIYPHTTHWPGQPGGDDFLPVRAGSEELCGVQSFSTSIATCDHQHLRIA